MAGPTRRSSPGPARSPAAGRQAGERADLASLPRQLRLELQYALQRRRDDCTATTHPVDIRAVARVLAASGETSLLALDEREWRSRLPRLGRQGRAAGRAAGLRAPPGHRPGRGTSRLGQRVPPRHLAAAQPGHPRQRLQRHRDPAVRRDQPAVAEGPGQAVDPVADQYRA